MNSQVEDRISQLIDSAEMFLGWSKDLYDMYEAKLKKCKTAKEKMDFFSNKAARYLALHNVIYFYEVALILNTLLKTRRNDPELSFFNYFSERELTEFEAEIDVIRKRYYDSKIGAIRNKLIAHKDIKNVGDPLTHFMNPINTIFIDEASEIVTQLKQVAAKYFKDSYGNNMQADFYKESHRFVLGVLKEEIEKGNNMREAAKINKCSKCDEEYEMHPGSNVCPKCGERTFVPAEEKNTGA